MNDYLRSGNVTAGLMVAQRLKAKSAKFCFMMAKNKQKKEEKYKTNKPKNTNKKREASLTFGRLALSANVAMLNTY